MESGLGDSGVQGDDSYLSIHFDESGRLLWAEIWGE